MPNEFSNLNALPINVTPTKDFFIKVLTRDISIEEAILDLIDNSVDKFIRESNLNISDFLIENEFKAARKKVEIRVSFDDKKFEIWDNCGGIPIEDAKDKIFRFGIPENKAQSKKTFTGLSVYGIGMKRAFFKLGRQITLASSNSKDKYEIVFDVETWRSQQDWNLQFESIAKNVAHDKETHITILKLDQNVINMFAVGAFKNRIREKIASVYSYFLNKTGMQIYLNDSIIKKELPRLAYSKYLQPIRKKIKYEDIEILLTAGFTEKKDTTPGGWYIFCNGRMVLEHDQTYSTGWGDDFPKFHIKFNHFIGYVYFWSKKVDSLPWTTTKEGIQFEAPVYQFALAEMKNQIRPILKFLSNMYPEDPPPDNISERYALEGVKSVNVDALPKKDINFEYIKPKIKVPNEVSIAFKASKEKVDKVKKKLGSLTISARKIGEHVFNYFYSKECQ